VSCCSLSHSLTHYHLHLRSSVTWPASSDSEASSLTGSVAYRRGAGRTGRHLLGAANGRNHVENSRLYVVEVYCSFRLQILFQSKAANSRNLTLIVAVRCADVAAVDCWVVIYWDDAHYIRSQDLPDDVRFRSFMYNAALIRRSANYPHLCSSGSRICHSGVGRLNGDLGSPSEGRPRDEPLVGAAESFLSIFIQKVAKS